MYPMEENSQFPRRSSIRQSTLLPHTAFDDGDYDLSANAVSDGFRPTGPSVIHHADTSATQSPHGMCSQVQHSLPQTPPPIVLNPLHRLSVLNRPSSIAKSLGVQDFLTLRNDGLSSFSEQSASSSDGANQGSVQPSHPYQSYPQRTHSNATASTNRMNATGAFDGLRGPTHPYTLYTQNTSGLEDTPQDIPVGFNHVGTTYQRQIGPDGEEAGDLIGPLGHMEELPPYTRYPEGPCQPKAGIEVGNTPSFATSTVAGATVIRRGSMSTPSQQIPGAGGIGLATRNPEFASTEDLPSFRSQPSIRSRTSLDSYHDVNAAAREFAEKPSGSKWHKRGRKKLCGLVPCWVVCLLVLGFVLMGVIMGAVVGTIVSRRSRGRSPGDQGQKWPKPVDGFQPLPWYPRGLPSLPLGDFVLPTIGNSQAPNACIKDQSLAAAWSCDMPGQSVAMNIIPVRSAAATSNYALKLSPQNGNNSRLMLGTQPPSFDTFKTMMLVQEQNDPSRQPAWYVETEYDKTVIVRDDEMPNSNGGNSDTPWINPSSPSQLGGSNSAMLEDGDHIWVCTWPKITLQVLLYPNQTDNSTFPLSTITPLPGYSATPTSTASFTNENVGDSDIATSYVTSTSAPPANPTTGPSGTTSQSFPKLVKLIERRTYDIVDFAAAQCGLYKVIKDGFDKIPVLQNGQPVTKDIPEVLNSRRDVHMEQYAEREMSFLEHRGLPLTPCACLSYS